MSVDSCLLSGYVPLSGVAAARVLTRRSPRTGVLTTAGGAAFGSAVASYTAALINTTAVPAWHGACPKMSFVFIGFAHGRSGAYVKVSKNLFADAAGAAAHYSATVTAWPAPSPEPHCSPPPSPPARHLPHRHQSAEDPKYTVIPQRQRLNDNKHATA